MQIDFGFIGGSGMGKFLSDLPSRPIHIPTQHGCVRGRVLQRNSHSILLLQRHASGHRLPPHKVPYLALATALKQVGAQGCVATAAVGSLHADWSVGDFAVLTDFLDPSARNITAFDRGVQHVPFNDPYPLAGALSARASTMAVTAHMPAVYINVNGPRYETPTEIQFFQKSGGDVVGMTSGSEAIVMAEIGIPYGCLGIITNLAAGLSPVAPNHQEVEAAVNEAGASAVKLLLSAIDTILS